MIANRPAGQPAVASISANGPNFHWRAAALAATQLVLVGRHSRAVGGQRESARRRRLHGGPRFSQEIIIVGGMDERDGPLDPQPRPVVGAGGGVGQIEGPHPEMGGFYRAFRG